MNAKKIFDKLVSIASGYSIRLSGSLYPGRKNRGIPGELLEKHLTLEEREELKNLSSKDIADMETVQRDVLNYTAYAYPENTTTVHKLFPIEKEEDDDDE